MDIKRLVYEAKKVTRYTIFSIWKTLSCKCHRKARTKHLRDIVNSQFNNYLDIRSFIRLQLNLMLLLRVLFSKKQRLLFRYQRLRSISTTLNTHKELEFSSDDLGEDLQRKKISSRFAKLLGYQATTPQHKRLLKGIFDVKQTRKDLQISSTVQDQIEVNVRDANHGVTSDNNHTL